MDESETAAKIENDVKLILIKVWFTDDKTTLVSVLTIQLLF